MAHRLRNELAADPLGRGYAGMSDAEAAADLNTAYRSRQRTTLAATEIYEAITPGEFAALDDASKQRVRDIFGLGDAIPIGPATNVRAVLLSVFGPATDTRAALIAAATGSVSRAAELGLGIVRQGDVQRARSAL